MEKKKARIILVAAVGLLVLLGSSGVAQAQLRTTSNSSDIGEYSQGETSPAGGSALLFLNLAGFNTSYSSQGIVFAPVARLILVFFSFLGSIFLALMIYAGIRWMVAGGNEEEVEKSRKIIRDSMIGLLVVLASYFLVYFIVGVATGLSSISPETQNEFSWNPLNWDWAFWK